VLAEAGFPGACDGKKPEPVGGEQWAEKGQGLNQGL
jgi:hypothetical protein